MIANLQPAHYIPLKLGDTVMLGCAAIDTLGLPADLTDVTVAAQVRTHAGVLVADLEPRWVNRAGGTFELWAPGDGLSTNWPLGNLLVDIRYINSTLPGPAIQAHRSDTFFLIMERSITW